MGQVPNVQVISIVTYKRKRVRAYWETPFHQIVSLIAVSKRGKLFVCQVRHAVG